MRKFKNWLNKPITWKSLFIASILSLLAAIFEMLWIFGAPKKIIDKFKSMKK